MNKLNANSNQNDFNDWRWQLKHRITDIAGLKKIAGLSSEEVENLTEASQYFPIQITPYYASLMKPGDPNDPIRMQVLPDAREMVEFKKQAKLENKTLKILFEELGKEGRVGGWDRPEDFIDEGQTVERKYPNRVAWLITKDCPTWCRHCCRRVMSEDSIVGVFSNAKVESAIKVITSQVEIDDVLITGGDAFTISTEMIDHILDKLLTVAHIKTVRFGTRTLVTLPQRVTSDPQLLSMLKKHNDYALEHDKKIFINTQFNHPVEITKESKKAAKLLRKTGCLLQNQAVLLKGVNDNIETLEKLFGGLDDIGVRPYYLYQGIPTPGANFRYTTVSKGFEIMRQMYERQNLSGHEKPRYIFADSQFGKIEIPPPSVKYEISEEKDSLGNTYEIFRFPWKNGEVVSRVLK